MRHDSKAFRELINHFRFVEFAKHSVLIEFRIVALFQILRNILDFLELLKERFFISFLLNFVTLGMSLHDKKFPLFESLLEFEPRKVHFHKSDFVSIFM